MADNKEKEILSKRVQSRDAQAKESMREKISFTKTLSSIDEAENKLLAMVGDAEVTSAQVGVINALLNSKWKKMDRLLPVLKAIEYTGDIQGDITFRWEK